MSVTAADIYPTIHCYFFERKDLIMKTKRFLAVILSLVMLLCMLPVFASAQDAVTLLAGSDFQNPDGNDAGKKEVNAIIDAMMNDGVTSADGLLFCGDYDHDLTMLPGPTSKGVNAVRECVDRIVDPNAPHIFIQGNHDSAKETAGLAKSGANDPENGRYGVFVINEDDYSWFNISREVVKGTANNLRYYLNKKLAEKFTGPVFVLSHLPLHYSYRSRSIGDTQYANYIFDVLNEAAGKGLNIFFLFGHDHSSGWDDYLGASSICLEKGDTINICKTGNRFKWTENTLNFTYMNAGYTGYYDNHNGGDDALTMTVFRITDTDVTVTRYDKNGRHNVASAGVSNSYKREKGYAPNTDVKGSPLTISLTPVTDITPVPGELDRFSQIIMFFFTIISDLLTAVC